ncbi:branched-chain amino acid aminotransferase [Gelidibacter algens]|uniref:branched-chain-amino-acid transaminase n=1 Tax=Gelidibacter algens TaxID=49280 RepID=A0A1A7QUF8_9FLAO|nr:aminotransferase class IV [Gelidibacter algens]OBX22854.1 aminotransferase class IV [Gelidibacter algens]RAJ27655.1 branched-chain amino acid aminotransferase [Gelidibacter algens]
MVNFNGTLHDSSSNLLSIENRGYAYGDALFETLKVVHGKVLFWEDHYFRLMASMRIMRMEIPMNFTMEFLESEILKTIEANQLLKATSRVRINVHRIEGGKYRPLSNDIAYNIISERLASDFYSLNHNAYTVELFKDYYIAPGLLSTLKTNNKSINVLGSIFAKENNFDTCFLLNTEKTVVEALSGNLFLVKDRVIKTPPLSEGCLKGIMRKQIMELVTKLEGYTLEETAISPFELQKADELFITNVIIGIQPVTKYRKKEFTIDVSKLLLEKLNTKIRLS